MSECSYLHNPYKFRLETKHLSLQEELLYRRLRDAFHVLSGLPANDEVMAKLARYDINKFRKCWPAIECFFVKNADILYPKDAFYQ